MPVYNGSKYLKPAIESVLTQTYPDFEFLIIDDESTDHSAEIVKSFSDHRIIYIRNEKNMGVALTLNKGIMLAKGEYIARMDADDICLPERFEKQVTFLDHHPDVAVIDCAMEHIDEKGISLNKLNSIVKNYSEIKRVLPRRNCLGHSSVMYRRKVIERYLYRQVVYEDLDLWYRLINTNHIIERLEEPLLLYRIHQTSITAMSRAGNTHLKKILQTKRFYLRSLKTADWLSPFNIRILLGIVEDYITWQWKKLKSK